MDFSGKTAIVTGGAQGIGRAVAMRLAEAGARVAVIDRNVSDTPCDLFHQGDLSDPGIIEAFIHQVVERFGPVHILVNNAMASKGGLDACGYDDFVWALQVGAAAPYWLVKCLDGHWGQGAAVVNISSTRAFQSQRNTESYSAAKGAITALTHAMAMSLHGRVRVNAVAPGWIDTGYTQYTGPDAGQHASRRVGNPDDIAGAVLYLCSDAASFITGQTLIVDGGMSARMIYHGDEGWTLSREAEM